MGKVEDIVSRFDRLVSDRGNWDNYFEEVSYYFIPHKSYFNRSSSGGDRVPKEIYDTTPSFAVNMLASGLQSNITNPGTRWLSKNIVNSKYRDSQSITDWLKATDDITLDVLSTSNFYEIMFELYEYYIVLGTPVMYIEEDKDDEVRFYLRDLNEVYIEENSKCRVDTVYRRFEVTVRQAYQMFGDNAGSVVLKAYHQNKLSDKVTYLHVVMPREDYDSSKRDSLNMPYLSVYIEYSKKELVAESGYNEFPYAVSRSKRTSNNDLYGVSQGMYALSDVKMLNRMVKANIESAELTAHPAWDVPFNGYEGKFRVIPNAINYRRTTVGIQDRAVPLVDFRGLPLSLEIENKRREMISKWFFSDLFLLLSNMPNRTATEVLQMVQERMQLLSPFLGRLLNGTLTSAMNRVFLILLRRGLFPPMPLELEEMVSENEGFLRYNINFVSPLAKAQKLSELKSLQGFVQQVGLEAQLDQNVLDNLDGDKIIRETAKLYDLGTGILRSRDDVDAIREEKLNQMEQQQQIDRVQKGVDIAQKGVDVIQKGGPAINA